MHEGYRHNFNWSPGPCFEVMTHKEHFVWLKTVKVLFFCSLPVMKYCVKLYFYGINDLFASVYAAFVVIKAIKSHVINTSVNEDTGKSVKHKYILIHSTNPIAFP